MGPARRVGLIPADCFRKVPGASAWPGRQAPSRIPCPGGARPWRGRRGLLDNILKLALALLSFLLPCWGCPGLLTSKPQVSQQRNSKQPLALALRVLGEYVSLPEQPSDA